MKKIAKGIHRLGQRAAEIRQVVEAMPAKAAELRAAVTTTAGHVKQLRTELATTLPPILSSGVTETLAQLREIEGATEALAEAGYRLAGIEHELGVGRRTRVLVERVDEVALPRLHALLEMEAGHLMAKALLTAIVQATELAAKVEFEHLIFTEILIEIGTGQTVRIGWRAADPVTPALAAEGRPPTFSQSSFFAQPAVVPIAQPAASGGPATASASLHPVAVPAEAPLAPGGRASALDRFKKMPDLTKRPSR